MHAGYDAAGGASNRQQLRLGEGFSLPTHRSVHRRMTGLQMLNASERIQRSGLTV
jgi:hypothetical protein